MCVCVCVCVCVMVEAVIVSGHVCVEDGVRDDALIGRMCVQGMKHVSLVQSVRRFLERF